MNIRDKFTSDSKETTKEFVSELEITKLEQTQELISSLNALRVKLNR